MYPKIVNFKKINDFWVHFKEKIVKKTYKKRYIFKYIWKLSLI
jgi:hypothetical protein